MSARSAPLSPDLEPSKSRCPFDGAGRSLAQSDGAADAARCHRVIAGDHDHPDPRFPAGPDGLRHVGARGVRKADET